VSVLRCRRASGPPSYADSELGAYGPRLGYPHTSAVRGAERAAGTSASDRAQRLAGVVPAGRAGIRGSGGGAEAQADPRGFDRAVRRALERLAKVEEGWCPRCRS